MAKKTDTELLDGWTASYAPFFEQCEEEFSFLSEHGFGPAEREVGLANGHITFKSDTHAVTISIEYNEDPWTVVSKSEPGAIHYGVFEFIDLLAYDFPRDGLRSDARFLSQHATTIFDADSDLWERLADARSNR